SSYLLHPLFLFLPPPLPPLLSLFPYTTLFRSKNSSLFNMNFCITCNVFRTIMLTSITDSIQGMCHCRTVRVLDCKHCSKVHIARSEEHTSELQSRFELVCRLLLENKKQGSASM